MWRVRFVRRHSRATYTAVDAGEKLSTSDACEAVLLLAKAQRKNKWPAGTASNTLLDRAVAKIVESGVTVTNGTDVAYAVACLRGRISDQGHVLSVVRAHVEGSKLQSLSAQDAARTLICAATATVRANSGVLVHAASSGRIPPEEMAVTVWAAASLKTNPLNTRHLVSQALLSFDRVKLPVPSLRCFAWALAEHGANPAECQKVVAALVAATLAQGRLGLADAASFLSSVSVIGSPDDLHKALPVVAAPAILAEAAAQPSLASAVLLACCRGKVALPADAVPAFATPAGNKEHSIVSLYYSYCVRQTLGDLERGHVMQLAAADLSGLHVHHLTMLFAHLAEPAGDKQLSQQLANKVADVADFGGVEMKSRAAATGLWLPYLAADAYSAGVPSHHNMLRELAHLLNKWDYVMVHVNDRVLVRLLSLFAGMLSRDHGPLQLDNLPLLAEKAARLFCMRTKIEPQTAAAAQEAIRKINLRDETSICEAIQDNTLSPTTTQGVSWLLQSAQASDRQQIERCCEWLKEPAMMKKLMPKEATQILKEFTRLAVTDETLLDQVAAAVVRDKNLEQASLERLLVTMARRIQSPAEGAGDDADGEQVLSPEKAATLVKSLGAARVVDAALYTAAREMILRSNVLDESSPDVLVRLVNSFTSASQMHVPFLQDVFSRIEPRSLLEMDGATVGYYYNTLSKALRDMEMMKEFVGYCQRVIVVLPDVINGIDPRMYPHVAHVIAACKADATPRVLDVLSGIPEAVVDELDASPASKLCHAYARIRVAAPHLYEQVSLKVQARKHVPSMAVQLLAINTAGLPLDSTLLNAAVFAAAREECRDWVVKAILLECARHNRFETMPKHVARLAEKLCDALERGDVRMRPQDVVCLMRTQGTSVLPRRFFEVVRRKLSERPPAAGAATARGG